MKRITLVSVFLSVAFYFYAGFSFIRNSAPTYDEPLHLASGYSYLETGKYYLNISDHPPLAEILSAVPARFMGLNSFISHRFFLDFMPYSYADLFLYENSRDPESIMNSGRIFVFLIWSTGLILFLYLWGRLYLGKWQALPVVLFCFSPVFISNNALITTDSAPSFFYLSSFFFAACSFYQPEGLKLSPALCAVTGGILSGLAMSSKYSMFILPSFWAGSFIAANFIEKKFKWDRVVFLLLLYAAFCLISLLLVFKGDIALYFYSLRETILRLGQGRSFFAAGHYGTDGIWWYFPFAFFLKTPFFIFVFFLLGLFFSFSQWRRYFWLFMPFFLYFLPACMSKVQIGIRHLLPAIPFALLISALGVSKIFEKRGKKAFLPVVMLSAFSFWGIASAHPFYLSYFTEAAGGPSAGIKYLGDSNLDWGQDIKTLGLYLKEHGRKPVVLSYFGSASPSYYGIKFIPLGIISSHNIKVPAEPDPCSFKRKLFAISLTNLQGIYYQDKNTFSFLSNIKPIFIAGESMYLYDLTDFPQAWQKLSQLLLSQGKKGLICAAGRN